MGYAKPVKIDALIGRTFASVTETDATVTFAGDGGPSYRLEHMQDCCESVWLEDVAGDLDDLVGSPVVMAEESTDKDATGVESTTWTFYKLGTAALALAERAGAAKEDLAACFTSSSFPVWKRIGTKKKAG